MTIAALTSHNIHLCQIDVNSSHTVQTNGKCLLEGLARLPGPGAAPACLGLANSTPTPFPTPVAADGPLDQIYGAALLYLSRSISLALFK